MAEEFRFMPLGLVRLRTFWLSRGLVRCNINTGVHVEGARRADVSLRDVTIALDGKRRLASANDVMHRKCAEDLGRFWKSQWVEMRPASEENGWFSIAHGDLCGGCHTCWWGRWKSQNRKIVYLSPYVEKPLNSKVIKSFVPEQRSLVWKLILLSLVCILLICSASRIYSFFKPVLMYLNVFSYWHYL